MNICFPNRVPSIVAAAFLAILFSLPVPAQEKPSPTSEYQYGKDRAQVEGIMKETDLQKRADALLAFVKEHPQSRMLPWVTAYYQQSVAPHQQAHAWSKVIAMNEAYIALVSNDKTALAGLMAAHYQSKNFAKAAEVGEKIYALNPDKGVASDLAGIYLQLQNTDKYLLYAEKVIPEFPIEQSYGMAVQVATVYAGKNDLDKAASYAEKVTAAFGEKVPQGVQESAWNATRASMYSLLGAGAYAKKDYTRAAELYEKVVRFDSKNDAGYYYIGMCKWRNQDLDGAMAAFAKSSVLNKSVSKRAQEYLEQIYKPRHNNTLDGIDEILGKAKADLGIS